MKQAFSLLEIIIVLIIVSILASFIVFKASSSISSTIKMKVKSDIALIRSSIQKINSKKILLGESFLDELDKEQINNQTNKLFSYILDFPLKGSTRSIKKHGEWIKNSSIDYLVYINDNTFLKYSYKNNSFICESDETLCKEYE